MNKRLQDEAAKAQPRPGLHSPAAVTSLALVPSSPPVCVFCPPPELGLLSPDLLCKQHYDGLCTYLRTTGLFITLPSTASAPGPATHVPTPGAQPTVPALPGADAPAAALRRPVQMPPAPLRQAPLEPVRRESYARAVAPSTQAHRKTFPKNAFAFGRFVQVPMRSWVPALPQPQQSGLRQQPQHAERQHQQQPPMVATQPSTHAPTARPDLVGASTLSVATATLAGASADAAMELGPTLQGAKSALSVESPRHGAASAQVATSGASPSAGVKRRLPQQAP